MTTANKAVANKMMTNADGSGAAPYSSANVPTLNWDDLQKVSASQMQHISLLATGKYGLDMRALMEEAGKSLANLAAHLTPKGPSLVVAGRGNNGGAGLAAARHLAEMGRPVWVVPTHEAENYSGVPKEQLEKLGEYKNIRVRSGLPKMKFQCIIDTAVGIHLEGPPRGRTLDVITVLNGMNGCPVISLDAPTGMDVDDGSVPGDVVQATATLSLVLPKAGVKPGGHVGELYLAGLGLPGDLFGDLGLEPFAPPAPWGRISE